MEMSTQGSLSQEGVMSKADQFWQYAEEAMRWARQAKTEKEKQSLIELARTWTQAAACSEGTVVFNDNAPEHRAP
jgi:hypothetical protein